MSIYKSGKNFNKSKKGISLIVLLITIIVMLILASAVVLYSLNNRSVDNANKVKIKSDIAAILDDYNNYNYKTLLSNASTAEGFDKTLLSADSEDVSYNGETLKGKKISDILPSIKGTEYEEKVYIKEGIIYIDGKDYSEEEIGWMIEQGINVLGQTDKVQVKFMESNVVVAKGFTKKLDVAYDLDNSSLSYSSEDEKIAKVDNKGNVTGINEGSTKITVTAGDVSDTCTVTVTGMSYAVTGIKLNKDKIVLPKGESETLVATISPLNATNKNVSWKSDDNSIASVDENGKVTANASGETVISATSEDGDKVATCKVIVDVKVEGLTLDKKELILELKEKSKLNATITPDDATNQKVKFRSSDKNIVTVDDKGNVIALLPGKASIVAESYENSDIYDICEVIVNFSVDSVKLNKDELILLIGETEKLNAVVLPDEASDKRINWNSSDSKVATVDDEGNVRAVSSGSTTITATSKSGNKSASCTVTVGKSINSFSVNPTSLTIKKGQKATITPVITPSDLTNTGVVFESLNNDIATIDNNGNIVGKNIGSTTVVATSTHDLSKTARCNVTVTNPITITASINNLAGKSCDLSINSSTTDGVISNIIVNLKESSESVYRNFANISDVNKNSDTRSINFDNLNIDTTYNVEIIVKTDKGETNTLTTEFTTKDIIIEEIKLNKATTKLAIGQSEVLDATILPDGAKNDLVWSSSNSSAVSVENNGKITGTGIGTSNITVKSSSHPDISATCSVTVVSPINITASQISNTLNSINLRIDALTTVGILSNVTVSYRSENDSEYTSSTTASPNQVTYTNESLSITGLTENSVYDIRVVASNNLNYSKTINLKCSTAKTPVTSITVSPSTTSLNIGQTTSLTASVLPTTASNKSYTWSSGNTDVATVNSSGLVTAVKEGTALITATSNDDNNIKGTCVVNVKEPITLSSSVSSYTANSINISISASTTSGNIQSIKVYTKETTNSSYTLKTTLSPNAASYSSTYNITGLSENTTYDIKIEATTTTSYTKTYEYEAATNKIVITSITLNKTNIALRTSSTSISGINTSEQLTATVNPSTVVNKEVIWSSADSNVAEVSQSGLVTAKSTGQTTITVKSKDDNSKTATCDVIVNPVAKVDDSKYYLTLQSAFNVATSSSTTIELLRSTSETLTFASGKVATLKTGSSSNIITGTLTNNGNLTIGGSGTITSTSSNTVTNNSSGTLTLNSSVQVKNTGANGRAIYNSGTVTIDGATITKTGSSYEAIYNYSGNLTMKSGTVSTEGSSSNAIEISSGTVTVNGGNVSSNYSSPTVLINGSNAIFNLGDKSKTLSETPRVKNTYKSSTAYGVQRSSGTFNFGNGSVVGYNEAISGTITVTRTSAKVLYKKSENTETATLGTAVAQIGNKYYAKLQDAFDVASSSTSITLLKDTAETLTFASGKSATLSTGTYTITGTLTNNGTLTISGSGTITNSTSSSTITNSSGSSLTLNTGVTIKNTSTGRTIYNSGTVTISGATVAKTGSSNETIYNNSGTLTMSSGTVSTTGSNSYAIDVNAGTVNVTGGTVSSNYSSSATIYINGGIFNLGTNASPCVSNAPEIHNNYTSGTAYGVYKNSGTFNFYDGKVIGYNFAIYNGINGVSSTYTGYAVLLSKSNSVETATLVEAVAKIGSKYYAKLQEAFDASSTTSSSPSSIYLLKSFSESSTFATSSSSAKYANLYLSNYTLTGTLTNYGSLSVYGNGTITNSTSSSIITNSSSGKLTLNSGVTIKNTSTGITITNSSSGTVIISGATVTKTNSSNETIYNNGGTLSMSSGTALS